MSRADQSAVLWIVGCQRSGTTMLLDALERDWRSRVYYEWDSQLYYPSLRLKEADVVSRRFQRDSHHLVATKPLLDSQWTDDLLRAHPQSHAIWIYRHYAAVAQSNLRAFAPGNGKRNLAPLLAGDTEDWRAERVPSDTLDTIRSLYGPNSSDDDAAALFWFARNSLYFELELDKHPRTLLRSYEETVKDPAESLATVYDAIGVARPSASVTAGVHRHGGRGSDIRLSKPVEAACSSLWQRLEEARCSRPSSARTDAPLPVAAEAAD